MYGNSCLLEILMHACFAFMNRFVLMVVPYVLPLQSPDGYTVASASADETLRFWQVFGAPDTSKKAKTKDARGAFSKFHTHMR